MYNAMIVKVGDSRECCADKVSGIRLVVAALPAYTVEELTTECKVGD